MSAESPRVFLPVLRRIDRELTLPIPVRMRILRELEFDLEELRRGFMERGLTPQEASRRALEAMVPEGVALSELGRLHAPPYARLGQRIGESRLRLWEHRALVGATLLVLTGAVIALSRVDLLADPSPFLWPVLAVGGILFACAAVEVFELWIKRDHARPGRRVRTIVALAITALLLGVGGAFLDSYALAAALEASPDLAGTLATRWLIRDAVLLSVAIVIALAGGWLWFVLTQWLAAVSSTRRQVLELNVNPNE